jgi:hypothetical protein
MGTPVVPDVDALRNEVSKLRQEMVDARMDRAARSLELTRNWMMVYTPTVTLLFLLFALLGYRGLADIQASRDKMEAISGQASKLLTEVNLRFDETNRDLSTKVAAISNDQQTFHKMVEENEAIVSGNRNVLRGFHASLSELEQKQGELKVTENHLAAELRGLSQKLTDTSQSLSSSISLTSGLSGVLSSSLNIPLITSSFISKPQDQRLISGFGFGAPGQLFLKADTSPAEISGVVPNLDLVGRADTVEVPSSAILKWSDNEILCRESDLEKMSGAKQVALELQVVTQSGVKSNVYRAGPALAPPSGLTVHVQ